MENKRAGQRAEAELLFRRATVVDGTGASRRRADVAVASGRIVAVGELAGWRADRIIEADGRVLAPGFIDTHTHDDGYLLVHPHMKPKVSQGITTVVTGNCGISVAPLVHADPPQPLDLMGPPALFRFETFGAWLDALRDQPANVNVAPLVGHSTLRVRAMRDVSGRLRRRKSRPCAPKWNWRCARARSACPPAPSIRPRRRLQAEIIAVCEPLKRLGGIYSTHLRDETDDIIASIEEALRVGRALDCMVVFSHHKVAGKRNFGRSEQTLAILAEAARSQPLCLDCHPYPATSTMLRLDRVSQSSRTMITCPRAIRKRAGATFTN